MSSFLEFMARWKSTMRHWMLSMILLITLASGCASVISNSEKFYRDMPRRPTNWREYLTD